MIFQESGITFNNVKKIGTKISAFPVGNPDNYEYGENSLSRKNTEHIEDKGGFVNAIDIDWNGVEVETISPDCSILILNTTSDLLNWIKCLEHRISVLEEEGGNVRPIDSEYYTIKWNDNGATTAHLGGSDFVYPGETVVLPTGDPIREYMIRWDANGGSLLGTGSPSVSYIFDDWWTATSGGDLVTSSTIPTRDITYYAHWISPSGIIRPNAIRNGYNFMGWATTSEATVADVTEDTIPIGPEKLVTYYAVWLKQDAVLSSIQWTKETASSFEGESIDLPTITLIYSDNNTDSIYASFATLEKDGNSFELTTDTPAGIYDNITAIYNEFRTENILTYTIKTRPVTLYTVTFNGNGGTISGNPKRTVNAGDPIGTFPSVTYSKHRLTKWTYSNGKTANSTDIVNDNIIIYAQWLNIYTIKFVDRGNTLDETTGPTGTQVTKPSDPSRSGYTFKGWNRAQNAGSGGTVITSIGTEDITYYAQWLEVTPVVTTYTVTYYSNGGNSTPSPQTVNAGKTVTLAGAINRNADSSYTYSFKEWNENSSGTAKGHEANETIRVDNDINLYAQWNKTPITPVTTNYYWYAGQTQPTSMNGTPTVDDINFTNNKWHTIGTTLTNINKTSTGGTSGNSWYVAVPKDKYKPTAADFITPDTSWEIINTINIGSVQYSIYNTNIETSRCAAILAVK